MNTKAQFVGLLNYSAIMRSGTKRPYSNCCACDESNKARLGYCQHARVIEGVPPIPYLGGTNQQYDYEC